MPSTSKYAPSGLNQWAAGDRLKMADVNADNAILNDLFAAAALKPEEFTAGNIAALGADGGLIDSGILPSKLPLVSGIRTVYLSPSGSDGNDGLSTASPMATVAEVLNRYAGVNALQLQFADGTYTVGNVALRNGGNLFLLSTSGTPANVTLIGTLNATFGSTVSASNITMTGSTDAPVVLRGGAKFVGVNCVLSGAATYSAVFAEDCCSIGLRNCTFRASTYGIALDRGCLASLVNQTIQNTVNIGLRSSASIIFWVSGTNSATTQQQLAGKGLIY